MDQKSTPNPPGKKPDEPEDVESEGKEESGSGDLSTKLDPDFLPPDTESPTEKRAREHPEETGS